MEVDIYLPVACSNLSANPSSVRRVAKPLTGQLVVQQNKNSTAFAIRVRIDGERRYVTLGYDTAGWTTDRARRYIEDLVDDIKAGRWKPPMRRSDRIIASERTPSGSAAKVYSKIRKIAQDLDDVRTYADSAVARRAASEALSAVYVAEDAIKRAL